MNAIELLKAKTTIGIEAFKELHGISTNYGLEKKAGLGGNSVDTIQKSGGITKITLFKLGVGVGYTGDPDDIVMAALNDMTSKDLTDKQVIRKAKRIVSFLTSKRRTVRSKEEIQAAKEDMEALDACEDQQVIDDLAGK